VFAPGLLRFARNDARQRQAGEAIGLHANDLRKESGNGGWCVIRTWLHNLFARGPNTVIASEAKQSRKLSGWIASSASPPRNDADLITLRYWPESINAAGYAQLSTSGSLY
jgi:hypothetical protein